MEGGERDRGGGERAVPQASRWLSALLAYAINWKLLKAPMPGAPPPRILVLLLEMRPVRWGFHKLAGGSRV